MLSLPPNREPRSTCPLSRGLELLGDRWTILLLRDLMFTNRREFGHFLNSGEGISTNILADRLERLQTAGIISKRPHPEHGRKFVYELTDAGAALAPTMIELCLWGLDQLPGTRIPEAVRDLMENDRDTLLRKVAAREPVLCLNL